MKKRILIVEDRDIERRGMETLLRGQGYEVSTAANAARALDVVADAAPDLILLDMFMPEADGWDFLKTRCQHPSLVNVPVLLVTGLHIATEAWARDVSADGLVRKPIDVDELLKQVDRLTGQSDGG